MGEQELLQQIRDLLDQYLALGANTPVAEQAQALAQAIDDTSAAQGNDPSAGDPTQDPTQAAAAPDAGTGMNMGSYAPDSMPKTFGEANKTATPFLKERNKKKKTSKAA